MGLPTIEELVLLLKNDHIAQERTEQLGEGLISPEEYYNAMVLRWDDLGQPMKTQE